MEYLFFLLGLRKKQCLVYFTLGEGFLEINHFKDERNQKENNVKVWIENYEKFQKITYKSKDFLNNYEKIKKNERILHVCFLKGSTLEKYQKIP